MVWSKKAQAGAAVLVALIAVLIILYVLFLPPQDRAALLGEGQPGSGTGITPTQVILFSSPVGTVYVPGVPPVRHDLPAFSIFAIESGSIIAKRDSLVVSNNAFEKKPATVTFPADPTRTKNAVLSLNLQRKTGGNVIVSLNGEEIFNQNVQSKSIPPIDLMNLQDQNELTFSASTVGFSFWRTNSYTLTNLKVTGDVTDLSGALSRQQFSLADLEYSKLQKVELSFVPVCDKEGKMRISVNGNEVFSGLPDCNNINTLELAPNKLNVGENSVVFSTEDARITIDQPVVTTQAKQEQNRQFSFAIDPSQAQGKQVVLRVLFPDAGDHKGTIKLNGNTIPLRAQDAIAIPVTPYVRSGVNSLQFEALDKEFEIVKFEVLLG